MIIDGLDLKNLLNFAKTYPQIRDIVLMSIRKIIPFEAVNIFTRNNDICIMVYLNYPDKTTTTSLAVDFDVVLDLFECYGHLIIKLEVDYWRKRDENDTFNKYVTKYVAPSLKEITLEFWATYSYANKSPLNSLGPFPLTESVKIITTESYEFLSKLNLTEIFPGVRIFYGNSLTPELGILILQHFPNLIHVSLPDDWGTNSSYYGMIAQTLELNPQIKSLQIWKCDWTIVQLVHRILPDIESLIINKLVISNDQHLTETLCFNNMKEFGFCVLETYGKNLERIPLAFGNLETIFINGNNFTSHWINIILENKNLKRIDAYNAINDTHLQQIANGLPNLEKMELLNENGYASINGIVQFMENANHLKSIDLIFIDVNIEDLDAFAKKMSNEWKYRNHTYSYDKSINYHFTRK